MEKISDRIKKIIDSEELSVRSFELKIGCSNGVIAKFIKNGTDINSVWLSKIIEVYPKYDARWIMTGIGSMIDNVDENTLIIDNNNRTSRFLLERIEELSFENKLLMQENLALKTQNKSYNIVAPDVAAEPELKLGKQVKNK